MMKKTWAMVAMAVVMAVWAALTDTDTADRITTQEWIVIAGLAFGAVGTYIVPNMVAGVARYAKGVVSFMTAGLAALYVVVPGGLTTGELLEVLISAAAAIGLVVGLRNDGYLFKHESPSRVQGAAPPL
jgi:peptidoglycan/LPS O-acetylase OafA/YrhL